MSEVILEAVLSERSYKSDIKSIRNTGKVPGIYYFGGENAISIEADYKTLQTILNTDHSLITLKIKDGDQYLCVFREVQVDPIEGKILHFDLMGIERGKEIELSVPLVVVGSAEGVRVGGILEHPVREIKIKCLPKHIPEKLEVDVTYLEIGDSIHINDLSFENITIMENPDKLVTHVIAPRVIEEVAPVEEEEVEEGEEVEEEAEAEEKDSEEQES